MSLHRLLFSAATALGLACFLGACHTRSGSPHAVAPLPAGTNTPPAAAAAKIEGLELFDGKTLTGWKSTDFAGHGEVAAEEGAIHLGMGVALTGITWTNSLPRDNYELTLETRKEMGSDFFCGLTFPVRDSHCSLIVGGWGGTVVGLSSVDGQDASENETTKNLYLAPNRWFQIRLRVTPTRIEAWIDDKKMVDLETSGRALSLRPGEIILSRPLGVATYQTSALVRQFRLKRLADAP